MIWFIIAILVAIGFAVREYRRWDLASAAMCGFFTLFASCAAALIISLVVGIVVYDPDHYSYDFDVMAAKDGSAVQGRFGIFGGFIDEKPYYFFYREFNDGRIKQGRIPANDTAIYQDQENDAFITVHKTRAGINFWGFSEDEEPTYEIHVPDGSVIQDVEFDLE